VRYNWVGVDGVKYTSSFEEGPCLSWWQIPPLNVYLHVDLERERDGRGKITQYHSRRKMPRFWISFLLLAMTSSHFWLAGSDLDV